MTDAYENMLKEYDGDRRAAFRRIREQFKPQRRTKEMIQWYREHPSPRHPAEKLRNLIAGLTE